jgi:hypothetical protein
MGSPSAVEETCMRATKLSLLRPGARRAKLALPVLAEAEAPAQFIVVEWSGRPGAGEPFPSGVMALSEQVTLHVG